jgi:uncharacterized protein with HEPN domain
MKNNEIFVRHMIDAIDEIEKILHGFTYEKFVNDPVRMYAIVRLFEILGEAASKLSVEFRHEYSEIPFGDIIGMRNKLIHRYFEVDLATLWQAYKEDLPTLKKALKVTL